MKTVTKVYSGNITVLCPECESMIDHHTDPKGLTMDCEQCDARFLVADDAETILN